MFGEHVALVLLVSLLDKFEVLVTDFLLDPEKQRSRSLGTFIESARNGSVCTEGMALSEHHMSYYDAGRCSSPAWGPTVPMEKFENRK